jgi:hypothetical protein
MKRFIEFIAEVNIMKGWMSPSGKAHIVPHGGEHMSSHHPEFRTKFKGHDALVDAQKKGFVRFLHSERPDGTHEVVLHYDRMHPHAKDVAHQTLNYLKPHRDSDVYVSEKPGLHDGNAKVFKPAKARQYFNN